MSAPTPPAAPEAAACPRCHALRAMFRQRDQSAACKFCGARFETKQSETLAAVRFYRHVKTRGLAVAPTRGAPRRRNAW